MTHEVEITGLANGGDGICRVDGEICFVPYALPGDRARVEVQGKSQGVLRGSIEKILTPSGHRVDVACDAFGRCGGCSWLHFAYPAQAEWKRRIVADCYSRIGKLDVEVAWLDDPSLRNGYRTRATFRRDGERWGFFEAKSHAVVDIPECPLCHPKLNEAFRKIRTTQADGPIQVTINPESEEVLVWTETADRQLQELFSDVNSKHEGGKRSSFYFDGVPIVNGAFAQSSLLLNRVLVGHVHALLENATGLLDLYCGSGNFSLALCERMSVTGLDLEGVAVMAALRAGSGDYRVGDERAFYEAIAGFTGDVVLVDPPRAGAKRIVPALVETSARRIVYVSCNPATLARDASALRRGGWTLTQATAVDMFPQTAHIECVAQFDRS